MVKNLQDLFDRYSDEDKCREFLVQQRWSGEPECPHCSCKRSYKIEGGKRFKCANPECWKKYSALTGTPMEASNIPLRHWFVAMYLVTSRKKAISSCQLARDLSITQKSAWFMIHRIREMVREKDPSLLEEEIQADEVYIGGVEENKHAEKRAGSPQKASELKMPIVGLLQTGNSLVLRVMPWITKRAIQDFIYENAKKKSILVTDGGSWYIAAGKKYNHIVVDTKISHKKDGKHKNGIENVWSNFRRMVDGTYHQVSDKHLQRYCDEFTYRFNTRKVADGFRWNLLFHQMEGRLKYVDLIKNNEQDPKKEGGSHFYAIETGE